MLFEKFMLFVFLLAGIVWSGGVFLFVGDQTVGFLP
jgi:hypothetical protein